MSQNLEPRTSWLELSQNSSTRLIRQAKQHRGHQVPLLLGIAGPHTLNIVFGFGLIFQAALQGHISELPVYDDADYLGNPTRTLHVGMLTLSNLYPNQYPGLGSRIDGVGFIRHKDASVEEYTRGVEAVIRGLNPLLETDGLGRIPTPGQFKYPLTGLDF